MRLRVRNQLRFHRPARLRCRCSHAYTACNPSTTYHFRIVAVGEGGTGDGADQTFTTLPPWVFNEEGASGKPASAQGGPGNTPGMAAKALRALIAAQLRPRGRTARIMALLTSGSFKAPFKAPEPGTAVIDWDYLPPAFKRAATRRTSAVARRLRRPELPRGREGCADDPPDRDGQAPVERLGATAAHRDMRLHAGRAGPCEDVSDVRADSLICASPRSPQASDSGGSRATTAASVRRAITFPCRCKKSCKCDKTAAKNPLFATFNPLGRILRCRAARSVLFTQPTINYPRGGVARHRKVLFEPSREG